VSTLRVVTSRRAAISLAVAAPAALGACELDPPSATPPQTPPPGPVPDAEVVASARTAILQMVSSLEVVQDAQRRLGPELAPWRELHAAHLEVLDDGSVGEPLQDPGPAVDAPRARQRLLAQEALLADTLADGARQAASGDLARALASMSAAIRQRLLT
jgi:hypothetical protein